MIKLSAVIPVYNVEKYFERCIRSLFEQTLLDIEYIFINDCTPDDSMNILSKVLEEYPNRKNSVKIVENDSNRGLWYSRQVGMKLAKGEYVIMCDSDDWLELNAYELLYNKAKQENADIVCCGFYLETNYAKKKYLYPYLYEDKSVLKNILYIEGFLYSAFWNKLFRRTLYVDNDVYNYSGINMWEDLGVTLRLRYYSKKTVILNEPLYHYNRLNAVSITSIPNRKNIEEQIYCVHYLSDFFLKEGVYEEYLHIIDMLKFKAKIGMIVFKETRDLYGWLNVFPESNDKIMSYKNVSILYRIVCWCVFHKMIFVGLFIVDFKYIVKKIYEAWRNYSFV